MSYNYLTQWDSPNFTPAAKTRSVWGRDRVITAIAIHWWDDPTKNPSFEGTVNTLINPSRGASAHYVATGTGRRVACLVSPSDNSWATNSANPYTISIECDPRCRDEDYDVVAELIANIRSAYGNLPLIRHGDIVSTRCPGNWDLPRLDALARTKDGSGDWGVVTNINQPAPTPTPAPTPVPVPDVLYRLIVGSNQVAAYSNSENAYNGYVNYGKQGSITLTGVDVTAEIVAKYTPIVIVPEPTPVPPVVVPTPTPTTDNSFLAFLEMLGKLIVEFLAKFKK